MDGGDESDDFSLSERDAAGRFPCRQCSGTPGAKAYKSRQDLLDHFVVIHRGLRFPCPFCPQEPTFFTGRANRRRHWKKLHDMTVGEAETAARKHGFSLDPCLPPQP